MGDLEKKTIGCIIKQESQYARLGLGRGDMADWCVRCGMMGFPHAVSVAEEGVSAFGGN